MMKNLYIPEDREISPTRPEARYAYYRRCQVFRKNGEQCKAPAEKDASICHAHAGQQAMAFRRDLERRIVLAEAVAEMRRQGKRDCDMTNLLMDFKGIQVTLAVMSRALIKGRIDCKTAGRLLVDLQTVSKLLRMPAKKAKNFPLINTDNTDLKNGPAADKIKVVTKRAVNAANAGNKKIVAIRSARQAPSPFRAFQRPGFNPILLTG